jgi:hypothetical protein
MNNIIQRNDYKASNDKIKNIEEYNANKNDTLNIKFKNDASSIKLINKANNLLNNIHE